MKLFNFKFARLILLASVTVAITFSKPVVVSAQTAVTTKNKTELYNLEVSAKEYFEIGKFHLALPIYETLHRVQPTNSEYKYAIAYCYLFLDDNEKALPYFEDCLKEPENHPLQMLYYAARTYHLSGKYDFALKYYEIYKNYLPKGKKDLKKGLVEAVDRDIQMCLTAKELVEKPLDIKVVNLGATVNSEFPEYAPILTADESMLVFTSNRPNTIGGLRDDLDGHFYEDVYYCTKTDTGWSAPLQMGSGINTEGHDASIGISPDGQKLLLYRYHIEPNASSVSGDLYLSELKGTEWSAANKLSATINTSGWEPSASFSPDEKTLFFTSDRPGGKGGTDIYTAKKLPSGEWSIAENIGDTINTPYDEDSPYMHPDGKTLYFSSNGHKSMGGFDIFTSTWNEETKKWSTPENVGYPINTPHDDLHFSWSADGRRVYFSSIRPDGYGDRDLYYADIKREPAKVMLVKGRVLDALSKEPLAVQLLITNKTTGEYIETVKSNMVTGNYLVIFDKGIHYKISIQAAGYESVEEYVDALTLDSFISSKKDYLMVKSK